VKWAIHAGATALLRFNLGFIYKHDRDVVPDGVNAVALATLEPLAIRGELDGGLARRANQDVE
jgi:hypothetical protein